MRGFFDGLSSIFYRKDIVQKDYNVFIDDIQRNRLSSLDLSIETEIISNSRHKSYIQCLALESIEYRYLLSGSINGSIQLFDLCSKGNEDRMEIKNQIKPCLEYVDSYIENGARLVKLGMISSIQWYPEDTGVFIASNMNGKISIFDTNTFSPVMNYAFMNNQVLCARIRPYNPDLIAVGLSDSSIRLCDPRTRDTSHVLNGHTRTVTCLEWSRNYTYQLISADMNGSILEWDVRKAGINAILRSFDWREDFSINAHNLNMNKPSSSYNVPTSTALNRFAASRAHDGAVMSLNCTSCGGYLLSSGNDGKLRLWNAHTGNLLPVKYNNSEHQRTTTSRVDRINSNIVPVTNLPYNSLIAEFLSPLDDLIIIPRAANSSSVREEGDIAVLPLHPTLIPPRSSLHPQQQPLRILKGHLDRVTSIVYRQPYQQLISAAKDGMVYVWDPKQQHHLQSSNTNSSNRKDERYDYQQILNRFPSCPSHPVHEKNSYSSEDNWSSDELEVTSTEHDNNIRSNRREVIIANPNPNKRSFVPPIIQMYLEDAKKSLQRERLLAALPISSHITSNQTEPSNSIMENTVTTTWNNIDEIFATDSNNHLNQELTSTNLAVDLNALNTIVPSAIITARHRSSTNTEQNKYKSWIKRLKTKRK